MALLTVALGLLIGMWQAMPNLDSSAIVDGRHLARSFGSQKLFPDKQFKLEIRKPLLERQANGTTNSDSPPQQATPLETPASIMCVFVASRTATPTASTPSLSRREFRRRQRGDSDRNLHNFNHIGFR